MSERDISPGLARCDLCGDPVDPNNVFTWHRIEGWARRGKAGGSDVALREPHSDGGVAHDHCVRRAQQGIAPLQESLL